MPFLQWRSAPTTALETRDKTPKVLSEASTAVEICGSKSVDTTSTAIGDENDVGWAALSILHVFHLVHVAVTADAGVSACVDEMSTAELVTSVRRLLCMGQLSSSNVATSTSKQEVVSPCVARALLLRLRELVGAHERFLAWMHTRSMGAVSGELQVVDAEETFLADAAAFARTLPLPDVPPTSALSPSAAERCAPSKRSSYAQLLSSNLYAISTFVDVSAAAATGAPPRAPASPSPALRRGFHFPPKPLETAALTLMYYLIALTMDVLEGSVLYCYRLTNPHVAHAGDSERVRLSQRSVDLPTTSAPSARFSASPSAPVAASSLHTILCTVLQEEGSRLLERLLRYEQREGGYQCESAGMGPTHHRLLTRHVLRRLGNLFFHPLRIDLNCTGITSHATAAVASDHTDATLVTWMAEQLQRMMHLSIPTAGREGSDRTSQDLPAPLAGEASRPCRFEAESLAELLRLLAAQMDTGASPSSAGAGECDGYRGTNCGGSGSTARHASATTEGSLSFSSVPEYVMLFSLVVEAAGAQGGGGALTHCLARETLMKAREYVVGYARHLATK
ncbi:hypothetical protein GH5_04258 [Leishmania sp. Ghana 2012 LV757]|uniref:hypothetical protein n=1 Tax=Leishmania sp. Ghana 2012 LV757 TaxID=2803181 RepID=UPI001B753CBE|nr:hypothetical protein GH5_04258 [Leishmania sp. Ghana 2012 LV757]